MNWHPRRGHAAAELSPHGRVFHFAAGILRKPPPGLADEPTASTLRAPAQCVRGRGAPFTGWPNIEERLHWDVHFANPCCACGRGWQRITREFSPWGRNLRHMPAAALKRGPALIDAGPRWCLTSFLLRICGLLNLLHVALSLTSRYAKKASPRSARRACRSRRRGSCRGRDRRLLLRHGGFVDRAVLPRRAAEAPAPHTPPRRARSTGR